ncbi:uncharacterized protein BJ171DRAFT_492677 [Polychytrium aggregatum]|uniref:uncharacterized protein n=1 Tax=Polychytrium aggregatum TaxID=110093 RepID=UPI0022FF35A9|nr:uncharacterized protein BJ171DRAFT_492677 [Polychytrium aggregatum]KAI9207417.1 hypothetical protein BJ171DRAFT_492677 [Polychytrium aggregatum]
MSAACVHSQSHFSPPLLSTHIYKEECTLCFDNYDTEAGIDVCLSCFNGGCLGNDRNHSALHFAKTSHPLAVNIKRVPKPERTDAAPPPTKITKLAIEAPKEDELFDFITSLKCLACGGVELDKSTGQFPALIKRVLEAHSAKKMSEIQAWEHEISTCSHTTVLEQQPLKMVNTRESITCSDCSLNENLWLCLTCGNLGCGRQQYGGTGGNGHGVGHFDATRHPVSVKLGTITPEGTADVYCYICDEERIDPNLAAHLASFGINIAAQQKTEKSLTELQLEQNLKFDFSMATEDGKQFEPAFGPGSTGLLNLGNTCYMASVLQTIFSLKPFQERYFGQDHVLVCRDSPATCFHCQMAKLADGLLSGRYSVPGTSTSEALSGQDGIAPSMFKSMIGKGHAEFSTMRQQDAQEFLQHLLKIVEQKERQTSRDPTQAFKFQTEQRLECLQCRKVKYRLADESALQLPVPSNLEGVDDEGREKYSPVAFGECLKQLVSEDLREYNCPQCREPTPSAITTRFKTFPDFLVCPMSRFIIGTNYVMKKLTCDILAPLDLNLDEYRGHGLKESEELLPEDSGSEARPSFNAQVVEQLMSMGFPEIRCQKACLATGGQDAEVAMNWLFEHMDDADIDDPIRTESGGSVQPAEGDVQMLCDMGFTPAQARRGLKETNNNVERAVDWLFSHAGELDQPAQDEEMPSADRAVAADDRPANYRLVGFISHRGTSTGCGHYIAHILKEDGQWLIFNDNKVAKVPDIHKAVGEGYIYVYQRQ